MPSTISTTGGTIADRTSGANCSKVATIVGDSATTTQSSVRSLGAGSHSSTADRKAAMSVCSSGSTASRYVSSDGVGDPTEEVSETDV
jgi:hypothetical protein